MSVGGPVHLVLNRGKEPLGQLGARRIVDAGCIDIEHLAPENLLGRTDVSDSCQQLVKVTAASGLLHPVVVEGESLDDVFPQPLGSPNPELCAAMGFHPVSD